MADITASMVKQLRDRTGQAMMDCKKALQDTDGDLEKAVDLLRKKGMAVLDKRSEKETNEGRVAGKISADGKTAVLVSLCSETDFTSKNENFQKTVDKMADAVLAAGKNPESEDEYKALATTDGSTVGAVVNDLISQTGEKIEFGKHYCFNLEGAGLLFCYVHFNNKIGTMIQIDADSDAAASSEATQALASDLAMHITAVNPLAVCPEELDPELVAREREVAAGQVAGKPENMIEQIVNGKINKWYQQIVLLKQPFVKDDSKTVEEVVAEAGKTAGGTLTVKRFARLQIG